MGEKEKVTIMVLKVDLQCHKCYKKVKKVLCKFPQIRDQKYDEKQNQVVIKVVCCSPEKIRDKICCKGGCAIKSIEIKEPEKPSPPPPPPPKPTPHIQSIDIKEPEKPSPPPPPAPKPTPHIKSIDIKEPEKPCPPPPPPPKPCPPPPPPPKPCPPPPPPPKPCPPPVPPIPCVPWYPPPIRVCCMDCYHGHAGGPCHSGYGGVAPYIQYDGYYGRPVYDSYGGDSMQYCVTHPNYFSEENALACTVM